MSHTPAKVYVDQCRQTKIHILCWNSAEPFVVTSGVASPGSGKKARRVSLRSPTETSSITWRDRDVETLNSQLWQLWLENQDVSWRKQWIFWKIAMWNHQRVSCYTQSRSMERGLLRIVFFVANTLPLVRHDSEKIPCCFLLECLPSTQDQETGFQRKIARTKQHEELSFTDIACFKWISAFQSLLSYYLVVGSSRSTGIE